MLADEELKEVQAIESFRTGKQDCKQEGRREVVEWIEENKWIETAFHPGDFIGILTAHWQSQKKKWGIDE